LPWSAAELAYMAGIIDGEGTICIFPYYGSHHKYGKYARYRPALCVSNSSKTLIDWIVERFGGKAQLVKRTRVDWKRQYTWTVSHDRAALIIKAIKPYLIIKYAQADLFLEFQTTAKKWGRCGAPVVVQEQRHTIAQQMTALNRRGPDALVA
jgi:hypothetical protein